MIHGLVTFTNQEITDEELKDSLVSSKNNKSGTFGNKNKKRDITLKQFDYIYKNKIEINLEVSGKFLFTDINLLLNAYEYWKFEKINKQTFV
jgi:hypothetical protein